MQITFDTTTITDDEVRGIFALLDTVRPSAFPSDAEQVEKVVDLKLYDPRVVELDEYATGEIPVAEDPDDPKHLAVHPIITTDSTGLPWDERIHAGTKALNADGTWRTKRGVDKALVAQVEAELRATSPESLAAEDAEKYAAHETPASVEAGEPVVTVAPPAPPAPEAPKAPLPVSAPVESESSAPTPPATSTQAASTTTASPFVALMKRVTTAQGAGKLTQPRVKELLESLDKKSIMDLRTDEDALASFAVLLDGEGV